MYFKNLAKKKGGEAEVDLLEFDKEVGVGVVVTDDDIVKIVDGLFEKYKSEIESKKHGF